MKEKFRRGRLLHAFVDLQEFLLPFPSPTGFCYLYLIQKGFFQIEFEFCHISTPCHRCARPGLLSVADHSSGEAGGATGAQVCCRGQLRVRVYWQIHSPGTSHMCHHSSFHLKMQINCLP